MLYIFKWFWPRRDEGNVLFLVLIVMALFGTLTYAVANSMRTESSTTEKEQTKLDQTVMVSYMAAINTGALRLRTAGVIPGLGAYWTAAEDQTATRAALKGLLQGTTALCLSIGVAALGAPVVVAFAGASLFGATDEISDFLGDVVDDFTARFDLFDTVIDHSGSFQRHVACGTPLSDKITGGYGVDDIIAGARGDTAFAGQGRDLALGAEWQLPGRDELNVLYTNRAAFGRFNESGSFPAGWYWSSSENLNCDARGQRFSDGSQDVNFKYNGQSVRCVRR